MTDVNDKQETLWYPLYDHVMFIASDELPTLSTFAAKQPLPKTTTTRYIPFDLDHHKLLQVSSYVNQNQDKPCP